MRFRLPLSRSIAPLAACVALLTVTACVRGRNDGGLDAAGNSSNGGSATAPQPGPLGGQNTDTTTAPKGTPAAAGGTAPGTSAPAAGTASAGGAGATGPVPAASAVGGTKRP